MADEYYYCIPGRIDYSKDITGQLSEEVSYLQGMLYAILAHFGGSVSLSIDDFRYKSDKEYGTLVSDRDAVDTIVIKLISFDKKQN